MVNRHPLTRDRSTSVSYVGRERIKSGAWGAVPAEVRSNPSGHGPG